MFRIEDVIEARFPDLSARRRPLPRSALRLLRRFVREAEINAFLARAHGLQGLAFVERLLEYFDFSWSVVAREVEHIPVEGRVVIVANHPLGLLDGIALLKLVSTVRRDVRVVANDVLMHFEPLRPVLLPVVNLGGVTQRSQVQAIHDALARDEAVIIFPSGEVSRAGPRGIRDGAWQAGFLRFAEHARAPVLPVHLGGRNSALFYSLSTLFKPLSTLMLVSEAMRQRGGVLRVRIGQPIPWREIASLDAPRAAKARHFAGLTYALPRRRAAVVPAEMPVAHPEDRVELRRELRQARLLGRTSDGQEIRLVDGCPDSVVLRELGRLREIAFRQVGEGTGKRRDLDAHDSRYRHLVLWDEAELQIAGAYRVGDAARLLAEQGPDGLYSHSLFRFSPQLLERLASAVELGRSFVQPRYQGLRSLDHLWQGIGAYLREHPQVRWLFGPVSISGAWPEEARQLLVRHYQRHHGCDEALAEARQPMHLAANRLQELDAVVGGGDAATAFRALKGRLAELGVGVPTLYKQYTEVCEPGGTRFLAFGVDPAFGGCVDGLVLVDLERLKPARRARYLGEPAAAAV